MKKLLNILFAFAFVAISSCGGDGEKKGDDNPNKDAQTEKKSAEQQKTFKITTAGAEIYGKNFEINEVFKKPPFSIKEDKITENQEGTEITFDITKIYKNGVEIATLHSDAKMLLSNDFQTEKGITVGSTIKEFIAAYPDYKIWYSYVSNNYVIETSTLPDAQFILDPLSFIGDENILNESDMVMLTIGQMEQTGKIQRIKVFEMIGC